MAGYVIHLAVAEEYKKNYPSDIDNYEKFINGIKYPDSVKDKSLTHFGPKSSKVNLKAFFTEKDILDSFNKGYFLHLVTDYLFYNKYLELFSKEIYNDYDILNNNLVKRYNIKITEDIKDKVFFKEGKTKILKESEVIKFIESTAKYRLEDIKEKVLSNDEYWLSIKQLKHID